MLTRSLVTNPTDRRVQSCVYSWTFSRFSDTVGSQIRNIRERTAIFRIRGILSDLNSFSIKFETNSFLMNDADQSFIMDRMVGDAPCLRAVLAHDAGAHLREVRAAGMRQRRFAYFGCDWDGGFLAPSDRGPPPLTHPSAPSIGCTSNLFVGGCRSVLKSGKTHRKVASARCKPMKEGEGGRAKAEGKGPWGRWQW